MRVYLADKLQEYRVLEGNLLEMTDDYVLIDIIDTIFSIDNLLMELQEKEWLLDFGDFSNNCYCRVLGYSGTILKMSVHIFELEDKRKFQYIYLRENLDIIYFENYRKYNVYVENIGFKGFIFKSKDKFLRGTHLSLIINTAMNSFHLDGVIDYCRKRKDKEGRFVYSVSFEDLDIKQLNSDALYDFICKNK